MIPTYFVSIINILHILQGVCKLMSTTVYIHIHALFEKHVCQIKVGVA